MTSNGKQALDAFVDAKGDFDVILLDYKSCFCWIFYEGWCFLLVRQMPVMDGYMCAIAIREYVRENNLRPISIVAITANSTTDDKQRCIAAGMEVRYALVALLAGLKSLFQYFVGKPFTAKQLYRALHDILDNDISNTDGNASDLIATLKGRDTLMSAAWRSLSQYKQSSFTFSHSGSWGNKGLYW